MFERRLGFFHIMEHIVSIMKVMKKPTSINQSPILGDLKTLPLASAI